jgi:hypothetical protein
MWMHAASAIPRDVLLRYQTPWLLPRSNPKMRSESIKVKVPYGHSGCNCNRVGYGGTIGTAARQDRRYRRIGGITCTPLDSWD